MSNSVDHITHRSTSLCLHGQRAHKFFQPLAVRQASNPFSDACASAPFKPRSQQSPPIVQVGSPPGQFAGWVHLHTIGSAHDANHLALGQHRTAAHAGPLGYMFHTLNRFLRHLHLKSFARRNDA